MKGYRRHTAVGGTSIPPGGVAILLGMLHAINENRDKLRPFGSLARVRLYPHHLIAMNSSRWTQLIINKQDLLKKIQSKDINWHTTTFMI